KYWKFKIKSTVFWPFKGKYWIIELASDYSYAVVGDPNFNYLWILSRTPKMEESTYQQIISRVKLKGFDVQKLDLQHKNNYILSLHSFS
ncbi:MAG: hypothetical protein EBQ94_01320, partial [Flavobacteriales bacterium]|nr:hypothetical protein [Flavobacteriales bacterium]